MLLPPGDEVLKLPTWATKPARWPLVRKYSPCLPAVVTDWPEPQPGTFNNHQLCRGQARSREAALLPTSKPASAPGGVCLFTFGWVDATGSSGPALRPSYLAPVGARSRITSMPGPIPPQGQGVPAS